MATKIPRSKEDDYTREMAEARRRFVKEQTGTALDHVGRFSFEPSVLPGNVENFMGVAQVPIGLAGPPALVGPDGEPRLELDLGVVDPRVPELHDDWLADEPPRCLLP